jgi:RHH-type proline utilization regulon transcriptional repressor/proline dehydrogenase/delta 1-pyrroline-5-carboxylate dehydrogenase
MEDTRIAGVAFTGSTATAKRNRRTLLADDERPLIPLIAETGGINAMIVDSHRAPGAGGCGRPHVLLPLRRAALLCAPRAACCRRRLAERTLEMLSVRRMDTLVVGDPADPEDRCRAGDRPGRL